jgi:flagellar biosynthesis/type III secretory pathway chaperone
MPTRYIILASRPQRSFQLSDTELPFFEIEALNTLLEQEFDFLKTQDFESFEKLQSRKQELLNFLIDEIPGDPAQQVGPNENAIAENEEMGKKLTECQNLQHRNELLINQKLTAIQEVLSTLGYQKLMTSKDTYEHLNKKKRAKD